MSSDQSRDELRAELLQSARRVGSQAALFSLAVADRLGLAGTDVECLDRLLVEGTLTVGRLAELTGLTTGAATRMVDRLEQAGYVSRVPDPSDRRRVLVEPVPGVGDKLGAMHDSLRRAQMEIFDRYDESQLRLLGGFLHELDGTLLDETAKMRNPSEQSDAGGSYAAPVGGVTSGRLIFLSGAPRIAVTGDPALRELYQARFAGPMPKMRARGGVVTISYPRFAWFDWRAQVAGQYVDASAHWQKDTGDIALNCSIPWAIELRGGVSSWTADLRTIRLESFELRGGASQLELTLAAPRGIVPVHIRGGINRISITRPVGVAAGLEVRGGVSEIAVDGEVIKGSGPISMQSPGADSAADRYEIQIDGGANKVSISAF